MVELILGLLSNLANSKVGRWIIAALTGIATFAGLVWFAFQAGVDDAKNDARERKLKNIRTANEVSNKVDGKSDRAVDRYLSRWVRK